MSSRQRTTIIFLSLLMLVLFSSSSYAIPAFSRQYGTSCSTCHIDFPKLNDFGKAFKDAGFKFPKDDETFIKVPPVLLGAPAQKDIWPHTIFPGTIPGMPPIGLRYNTFFQVVSKNRNAINVQRTGDPTAPSIPRTIFRASAHNVNIGFDLSSGEQGVEFSGDHTYRGYQYSLAIVNQNTSGNAASPANISPVTNFTSDSNFKDLYGRLSYRFNLERDPASRNEIQAAGTTGPRDHTYLNLGTLYFYGRSVQRASGLESDGVTQTVITAREPFYRVRGDFSFNYHSFNLLGQYLVGRDHNL